MKSHQQIQEEIAQRVITQDIELRAGKYKDHAKAKEVLVRLDDLLHQLTYLVPENYDKANQLRIELGLLSGKKLIQGRTHCEIVGLR